ncbi:response regulator with CheY-like receiver, AAA-type ATPase, and DNA-binding domains [Terriglobus roseus DSM 18391]|uniref:Response regulator with CheY-like receiver, AAA-type ATPase, and DNA-binding domains n=1 Tax=Terriglobus roseus (strain DSM 18391 / NRRL B-41598 / KBS 63) TaxID=926566 RepID=I3ZI87_TERRK|nr:sigma-54 dependent transcriptional regulator [Terriglobus roseus]AFL88955.1 response regulator with CheY-like receiver, AAA-type ATPase, and DNA-binding domains [Terriglobus roseus DSM 18391]
MSDTKKSVRIVGKAGTLAEDFRPELVTPLRDWQLLESNPNGDSHHVSRNGGVHGLELLRPHAAENPIRKHDMAKVQLLVLDDDPPVLKACCEIASGMGFAVHAANSAEEAREAVRVHALDVVLMDLKMPAGGLSLLEEIRMRRPRSSIVVMTAFATVSSAVEAIRLGASDYLTKPFAMDELTGVLERAGQRRSFELESRRVQQHLRGQNGHGRLIGSSPAMEKLYRIVAKVALSTHPVLILGESGTGKETVARTIHTSGPNGSRRFAVVECGQLAPAVLESELFGYSRSAYTGFDRSKDALLTSEEGGTLFLDQVSEMPLDLQAKLLRALQDKEVRAAGSRQGVPLTVRILAGSSRNLSSLVDQGLFRKDLYYRLNVVGLHMPPLRERPEDIPLLAEHFLERMRRESAVAYQFSADAMRVMSGYGWPGNVRELEGAVERACALSSGPVLHMGDLPTQMQSMAAIDVLAANVLRVDERRNAESKSRAEGGAPAIVSIAELEREAILNTIRQLHGDKLMAAKLLGIGKTTLYRKLKEYGISDS